MENTIHAKYGLKRVINASGRMSILGVSAPTDTVMEAMKQGGQKYVEMSELVKNSGEYIATKLKCEAALVVNSASSGIALSVAGIVTKGQKRKALKLHQEEIKENEILILKGHNVQYGAPIETMIALGGGKVIEVGYANEGKKEDVLEAINEKTVALLFVQSHHAVQKNMLTVEEMAEISRKYQIPLIIDAAAEEDLLTYIQFGDIVIYSGSKALEGPTSGIVCGKAKYVDMVKVQMSGIGRGMKVGKEQIFGLLQALDQYEEKIDNSEQEKKKLERFLDLNKFPGVHVSIIQDEAGRAIYRARISLDAAVSQLHALDVVQQLKYGKIAVYTRDYGASQGFFDLDARSFQEDDLDVLFIRLIEILGGESR
ncbi:DgaE family pyridoxal phosphate-dependent ammonia lyase [Alkalihalobacillus pseudalcaliphilus]|uniref:DgaE family pyridoxal phosphate-dependent ammonia lyase n=1 Tax=Alkalihalobacillus pseudalcaliphilus TaxID=79884 RepID=UPI00064D88B1|nr:DgaE family pyridoxal phosphate-dependent ammonia lyase [Alkalihalobacillus pseudalcaliphilus]KMK76077.1 L-seryl-tRNA selenium transferase [Alkalihalobacillus pseudalcaliphilus]